MVIHFEIDNVFCAFVVVAAFWAHNSNALICFELKVTLALLIIFLLYCLAEIAEPVSQERDEENKGTI